MVGELVVALWASEEEEEGRDWVVGQVVGGAAAVGGAMAVGGGGALGGELE